jgi:hypothetical protein
MVMPLRLVKKQTIGNSRSENFRVTLEGSHTTKQKISMLLQAKYFLHEQGIDHVGMTNVYFPLIDSNGYPLTNFRDGRSISDYNQLIVESPYHCAADEYDRRPVPPLRFTPF